MRAETSIPVPNIYSYNIDPTNNVGAPYVLMNYIDGTTANKLRESKKCHVGLYGKPEQDHKFKRQMAKIQAELASHKFDSIGSLCWSEFTKEFFIDQETEMWKGPWASSSDYFNDLAAYAAAPRDIEPLSIPGRFRKLISDSSHAKDKGPFKLTNSNFGAHTILVGRKFRNCRRSRLQNHGRTD